MSIKPIMEGYLQKLKCHKSLMGGNWNKRWVSVCYIGVGELCLCYWDKEPTKKTDPQDYICIKEIIDIIEPTADFKINFPIGKIEIGEEPRTDFGHINSEIKSHFSTLFIIKSLSRNFMFNCESTPAKKKWVYCLKKLSDILLEGLKWQTDWGEEPELPHYLKEFYEKSREKITPKAIIITTEDDDKSSQVKPIRKGQPIITPRPFSKAKSMDIPSTIKIPEDASEPPRYRAPRKTMLPTVDDLKRIDIQHSKSNTINSNDIIEESDVKIIHVVSVPTLMDS